MAKYLLSFVIFSCLVIPFPATSKAVALGSVNCREWVRRTQFKNLYQMWLLGMLSGFNLSSSSFFKPDFLNQTTSDQIFVWMDNYCQKNPLRVTGVGGFELFMELTKK